MYRGHKAIRSWITAGALTAASAVGIVAAGNAIMAPVAAPTSSTSTTTPIVTTTTPAVGLTTFRTASGDEGSYRSSATTSATYSDN